MTFVEADLPKRGSTVWPEVASDKSNSSLNMFHVDLLRLGAADHRPVEIAQRSCHAQHMGRALRPPLPLATIQSVLTMMLELPEPLESLDRFRRQWDTAGREVSLSCGCERSMMRALLQTQSTITSGSRQDHATAIAMIEAVPGTVTYPGP
jgi:hypothetical protein